MNYKRFQKPIQLKKLLKEQGIAGKIKWKYYGYGILSAWGEDNIETLPKEVLLAKCFAVDGDVFNVDGAL